MTLEAHPANNAHLSPALAGGGAHVGYGKLSIRRIFLIPVHATSSSHVLTWSSFSGKLEGSSLSKE